MTLNKTMKEELLAHLTEKAFPNTRLKELEDALADKITQHPEIKTATKIADEAPEYIKPSTTVYTFLDLKNTKIDPSCRRLEISLRQYYAVKGNQYFFIDPEHDEKIRNSCIWDEKLFGKEYRELEKFVTERNGFVEKVAEMLSHVSSSAKIREMVPATKEFLGEDDSRLYPVPQQAIDNINAVLSRRKGTEDEA